MSEVTNKPVICAYCSADIPLYETPARLSDGSLMCIACVSMRNGATIREYLTKEISDLQTELVALKASQKEAHQLLKYACDWLEYLGQPRVITRPNNTFTFQDIYSYFNSLPSPPETTEQGEG